LLQDETRWGEGSAPFDHGVSRPFVSEQDLRFRFLWSGYDNAIEAIGFPEFDMDHPARTRRDLRPPDVPGAGDSISPRAQRRFVIDNEICLGALPTATQNKLACILRVVTKRHDS
jgi:hypothetical protein